MNVEIGAEAALIPEKEYISGIFVAVFDPIISRKYLLNFFNEMPLESLLYRLFRFVCLIREAPAVNQWKLLRSN